jgi:hypothetical protein
MSRSITASDANGVTFETVGSTGGFSAGDLIYYGTTGYNKIPASAAPTTATSLLTKAYPTLPTTATSTGYFTPTNFAGIGFSRSVTLLSNGNAVVVYGNPIDGYPYFLIFTPSTRAIVVGPTAISTVNVLGTGVSNYNIGATAFTGGNFLVYWGNSAGGTASRVNYATYTDAGVAVVAVTQDTSLAVNNTASGFMRGITLANGGFVLAFGNNTSDVSFRAYNASGVGQFAWVTLSTFANGSNSGTAQSWGLAARSDNTYLISGQSTTATLYNYAIYNYTGTAVVATTTFAITGGTTNGVLDCATLSDGTTFVIAYAGQTAASTQGWNFRFLPTGNVLGSVNFLQGNFNSSGGNASSTFFRVWPLSSLRFLITGADNNNAAAYAVFNSTATPLLGINGSTGTASNTRSFGSYYIVNNPVLGVIETGGNAELYLSTRTGSNTSNSTFIKMDLTTYNLVSSGTASGALTIPVATTPTSGYTGTNSTPSKASFALSNGVYPYAPKLTTASSVTASGVYSTPTSTGLTAIGSFDFCVLSNGNICVVTNNTSGDINAYIYNPISLALISTGTLTSITGTSFFVTAQVSSTVRVAALDSGSFCIANSTSATNLRLTAFTSSFVQQGSTVNITTFTQTFNSSGQNFSLASISGNRIVVVYQTSTLSTSYAIYTSTVVLAVSAVVVATDVANIYENMVCASPNGFTVGLFKSTAAQFTFFTYIEYSANLFTQPTFGTGVVGTTLGFVGRVFATNNNGQTYFCVHSGGTSLTLYTINGTSPSGLLSVGTTAVTGATIAPGITAAGNPFLLYQDTTNLTIGAATVFQTAVPSITGWTSPTVRVTTPQIKSLPMYGNMVLVAYVSSSPTANTLIFGTMLVNGSPDSAVFTTADATNGVPVYPLATTTVAPAVTNFTFAGVAVTDCTAGGTGVIQTTGATNLNSTYPTTTAQTFDYTGQVAPGLKGTISGRSISMRKS